MKAPRPVDPLRSEWMRRVRTTGTRAELRVGDVLRGIGASYRRNVRTLPGSPDFANKTRKWAIFVNGCFWHHHTNCRRATVPKTNFEFWSDKFTRNRRRDANAIRSLRAMGFRVAIIWECQVGDLVRLSVSLSEILEPRRVDVAEAIDHRRIPVDVS